MMMLFEQPGKMTKIRKAKLICRGGQRRDAFGEGCEPDIRGSRAKRSSPTVLEPAKDTGAALVAKQLRRSSTRPDAAAKGNAPKSIRGV